MYNELDIENLSNESIKRYNRKNIIYSIIAMIIVFIILFIQKELFTKILTSCVAIAIYFLRKATISGFQKQEIKCVKEKQYKILETEITDKYIYNSSADTYDNSSNHRCLLFKDTDLIFEVEWMDQICSVGDKVLLQIVEYQNNEYIINLLNITKEKKIIHNI